MGRSIGTLRLHAIKARLYNSGKEEEEEIRVPRRTAPEMRRRAAFAPLRGKVFLADDMLAMCAEVRSIARRGVLIWWRGGRCSDVDTYGSSNIEENDTDCSMRYLMHLSIVRAKAFG